MAYEGLKAIAATYPAAQRDDLPVLAESYNRRYEREILDLAAIAADVSIDDITTLGLEPDANPQLLETMHRLGYSEESFQSWNEFTENQLEGLINHIKGTYFEVLVAEKLNAGETIGDIKLLPGEVARLADSTNQAGWDIEITGANDEIVEHVQLKAVESIGKIAEALNRYPEIRIIAPKELESQAEEMEALLSTNITIESLNAEVGTHLQELTEDTITNIMHQSAEAAMDFVPGISLAVIGVTEAGQVLMGRSTVEESLKRGTARLGRSSVYTAIGATLSLADAGIVSVPTVTVLRVAEGRVRHRAAMGDHLEEKTEEIRRELNLSSRQA